MVVLSSTEAELRGIAKGVMEVLWLKKLLRELGFSLKFPAKLKLTTWLQFVFQKIQYNIIEPNISR